MKKISVLLLLLAAFTIGCKKKSTSTTTSTETEKKEDPCKEVAATYASVEPIFTANCVKCHTLPKAAKGVDLNSYEATSDLAKNGKLSCVLKGESCKAMPPGGKLSDQDIKTLVCWINNGATK